MKHIPFICTLHGKHNVAFICTLVTFAETQCVWISYISFIILFNKSEERETLGKHILHGKTAASDLLKMFIGGNKRYHNIDAHEDFMVALSLALSALHETCYRIFNVCNHAYQSSIPSNLSTEKKTYRKTRKEGTIETFADVK